MVKAAATRAPLPRRCHPCLCMLPVQHPPSKPQPAYIHRAARGFRPAGNAFSVCCKQMHGVSPIRATLTDQYPNRSQPFPTALAVGEPTVVIAMEYCDAGSLADAIAAGRFRERVKGGYGAMQPHMPVGVRQAWHVTRGIWTRGCGLSVGASREGTAPCSRTCRWVYGTAHAACGMQCVDTRAWQRNGKAIRGKRLVYCPAQIRHALFQHR